jgi:hypothetical protein
LNLHDPAGLEHDAFDERARHFAARLEATATAGAERSAVLDQLFVDEAREQIELLRDALATLPPDAYVLLTEALKLAQHAEMLEIWASCISPGSLRPASINMPANSTG